MTYQATVESDYFRHGVKIHMRDRRIDGAIYAVDFGDVVVSAITDATSEPSSEPLRLDEDAARAMYEALARHFGGAPDMAVIRRDYDHEKSRVDKMLDALIRRDVQ